jgi:predicted CXXCH cytochrome family protein
MKWSALLLCLLPVLLFAKDRDSSAEKASCSRCHIPHVSDEKGPPRLRKPSEENCMSCHDGVIAEPFNGDLFGHAKLEDNDAQATCTSCHSPHAHIRLM